jgi:transposase-like protein
MPATRPTGGSLVSAVDHGGVVLKTALGLSRESVRRMSRESVLRMLRESVLRMLRESVLRTTRKSVLRMSRRSVLRMSRRSVLRTTRNGFIAPGLHLPNTCLITSAKTPRQATLAT